MVSKRVARVEARRCVACGACETVCPKDAVAVWRGCRAVVSEAVCIGCGRCEKVCPAGCIEVSERRTTA